MTTRQHLHPHVIRSARMLSGHPQPAPGRDRHGSHDCRGPGAGPSRLAKPELTEREIEVLLAWLRTDSKAQVGRTLYIAPCTVGTHLERIRAKYAAVGRVAATKAALAARAIQDGLVCVYDL